MEIDLSCPCEDVDFDIQCVLELVGDVREDLLGNKKAILKRTGCVPIMISGMFPDDEDDSDVVVPIGCNPDDCPDCETLEECCEYLEVSAKAYTGDATKINPVFIFVAEKLLRLLLERYLN